MSVTIQPPNPVSGQVVTFSLKYEGNPPPPNDVHVDVEDNGVWKPVTGYDRIPAGLDPVNGFDLSIPPTPSWSGPGTHRFRVRWSREGQDIGAEAAYVTTSSTPGLAGKPADKPWDWGVFFGKVLGGALGGAITSGLFNWWTGAAIAVCLVTGAIGGAGGGAAGQVFVWLFDDPKINWNMKSAFLFTLFFSLTFSMIFGLLAIGLEREMFARGEIFNPVNLGISGVAAFLATILGGVLNNLRDGSSSEP